jgi:hypothetical protein
MRRRTYLQLAAAGGLALGGERARATPGREATQRARLAPGDGDADDTFGAVVALDGGRAVVGAPADEDPSGAGGGSASVFERGDDGWTERAKLAPEDGGEGDRFGHAVAVEGDRVVVGAPREGLASGADGGAAYAFERGDDGWTERAKFAPKDGDADDRFGTAVALKGDRVLATAPGDEDPDGPGGGSVYEFERVDGEWLERAKLAANTGDSHDRFGSAVDLGDDHAVIGADRDEDPNGAEAGSAYVYEYSSIGWTEEAKLVAENGNDGDRFGAGVALDGGRAVVGAPGDEFPNGDGAGSAYVFERTGDDEWTERTKLAPADGDSGDRFGTAVALDGDRALVTAPADEDPNGADGGSASVFGRAGGAWREGATLALADGDVGDRLGTGVALDGGRALLGAAGDADPNGDGAGAAYVFDLGAGPAAPTGTAAGSTPMGSPPEAGTATPGGDTETRAAATPTGAGTGTPAAADTTAAGGPGFGVAPLAAVLGWLLWRGRGE